jgi:hypothetical protein
MFTVNRRSRFFPLASILALGVTATPAAHAEEFEQHAAHEHGKITINAALEKQELSIELDAPADNVVGFEHAPRTEAEKTAVREAATLLKSAQGLFGFPPAAKCRLTASEVRAPHWESETSPATEEEAGHEHHADYEARFTYRCEAPQALTWFEPWLLAKLRSVHEARINLITAGGQRSQVVTQAHERVALRQEPAA